MPYPFEIIAFENHDIYDTNAASTSEDAVKKFVEMCRLYVNPHDVSKRDTDLSKTNMSVIYVDRSGNDKPMMILLNGPIDSALFKTISDEIDKLYIQNCEDCGVEIELTRALCKECANK